MADLERRNDASYNMRRRRMTVSNADDQLMTLDVTLDAEGGVFQ